MSNTETVIQFPRRTRLRCGNCGAKGEMGCGCGVGYVTAAETAAHAVAANPEKSDRAIAKETGVSDKTVAKARRSTTAENSAVEKRTGRDGKSRRKPKRKPGERQHQAAVNSRPEEWAAFKEKAASAGVSVADLLGQVVAEPEVNPSILSMTAQAKLAAAERQMRRSLEAELVARVHDLDEEVRQRVLAKNAEYLAKLNKLEDEAARIKRTYSEFMDRQTKIFSKDEFKLVVLCVHSDASITEEKRTTATRLLLNKRFALTGEK